MIIYAVWNKHNKTETYFRRREEALRKFNEIKLGRLVKYTIKTPINKDTAVAMLNREGWADAIEDIAVKG